MASREIDYPELVDEALRSVARRVLARVAEEGLPGDHHFFITFETAHPEVELAASLRQSHPEEMTIVLQNQFWDLAVEDDGFAVSLRFGGAPHRLRVPWTAVRSFVDPEAEFGLRFGAYRLALEEEGSAETEDGPTDSSAQVVSLDEFRKRDG